MTHFAVAAAGGLMADGAESLAPLGLRGAPPRARPGEPPARRLRVGFRSSRSLLSGVHR
jgi:hypothetical protein